MSTRGGRCLGMTGIWYLLLRGIAARLQGAAKFRTRLQRLSFRARLWFPLYRISRGSCRFPAGPMYLCIFAYGESAQEDPTRDLLYMIPADSLIPPLDRIVRASTCRRDGWEIPFPVGIVIDFSYNLDVGSSGSEIRYFLYAVTRSVEYMRNSSLRCIVIVGAIFIVKYCKHSFPSSR